MSRQLHLLHGLSTEMWVIPHFIESRNYWPKGAAVGASNIESYSIASNLREVECIEGSTFRAICKCNAEVDSYTRFHMEF